MTKEDSNQILSDGFFEINIKIPEVYDTLTLAKDSVFQTDITRSVDCYNGQSIIFCAIIEELIQLKKRVEELENKLKE